MIETTINGVKAYILENGKILIQCAKCKQFIQYNKFLFGSLHICD